jgi:hypothetical protein
LSGDAVLRAVAAWQFGWDASQQAAPKKDAVPYLVAALADPYSAVRYVAGHALQKLVPGSRFDYLASPEQRQEAGGAILRSWLDGRGVKIGERGLAAPDLSAIDSQIQRLIDKRDDSPIRAME